MRRVIALACVAASLGWACTQDFGIFQPRADAGGGDGGGSDGGVDVAVPTCTLSPNCFDAGASCGLSCSNAYQTCQTQCGGNQNCRNQCKGQENTCFQVCQSACVSCAADASCTSACQTAVGN